MVGGPLQDGAGGHSLGYWWHHFKELEGLWPFRGSKLQSHPHPDWNFQSHKPHMLVYYRRYFVITTEQWLIQYLCVVTQSTGPAFPPCWWSFNLFQLFLFSCHRGDFFREARDRLGQPVWIFFLSKEGRGPLVLPQWLTHPPAPPFTPWTMSCDVIQLMPTCGGQAQFGWPHWHQGVTYDWHLWRHFQRPVEWMKVSQSRSFLALCESGAISLRNKTQHKVDQGGSPGMHSSVLSELCCYSWTTDSGIFSL